ncbi:hypothetical protein MUK42_27249 [Musa troglodytarum]|uniref:Transmembrane protein n=1 Tax=Musa troglodytarum TaxID=320322 RepID=A0A9E7JS40_9LILI|nr:hypothetical protein MUK42_27249 [Musa troglodytarum]
MSSPKQPTIVYPQYIAARHGSGSGSGSKSGSFAPVFIVLAVIAVLVAAACYVGQVFARRYLRPVSRMDRALESKGEDGSQVKPGAASGGSQGADNAKDEEVGGSGGGTVDPGAAGAPSP